MCAITRWFPRIVCATVVLACTDATDPAAPTAATSSDNPQLFIDDIDGVDDLEGVEPIEPTAAELAELPSAFRASPTLLDYWTDVGFIPAERRAYAQAYMKYFATNATQEVTLDLQFERSLIATRNAHGENTDLLPFTRSLWTTALLGVSGSCGHLADGASVHTAWHQLIAGGWKFFSWGNTGRTSGDMKEQDPCAPPPPPPVPPSGTGGTDDSPGYQPICEFCQQWLEFTFWGELIAVWWECEPVDLSYCETYIR